MKLAILLPDRVDSGWLWRAGALARALHQAVSPPNRGDFEVVIGLPRALRAWNRAAADLRQDAPWISVRALDWRPTPADQFHRVYPEAQTIDFVSVYNVPRDGGWNYADCDAWIVCGDPRLGAPAPLRPTAVYCRGLNSRYIVGEFGDIHSDPAWTLQVDAFLAWRKARSVFAVEAHTLTDVISFAGVARAKTLAAPSLWSLRTTAPSPRPSGLAKGYIAWMVEPKAAHDPIAALAAAGEYVSRGGRRAIALVGEGVSEFDPKRGPNNPYRQALASNVELLARVEFITTHGDEILNSVIADCGLVWSSLLADGEPDAPRLAAQYGKWLLAPDFPQMRALGRDACSIFYDPFQSDALIDALFEVDRGVAQGDSLPIEPLAMPVTAYAPVLQSLKPDV